MNPFNSDGKMICFGSSLVSDGKNGGETKSGTGGIITGLEHRSQKKRLRTSTTEKRKFPDSAITVRKIEKNVKKCESNFPDGTPSGLAR